VLVLVVGFTSLLHEAYVKKGDTPVAKLINKQKYTVLACKLSHTRITLLKQLYIGSPCTERTKVLMMMSYTSSFSVILVKSVDAL
jgi:hypothetical protein